MTTRRFFSSLAVFVSLVALSTPAPITAAPLDKGLSYFLPAGTEYDPEVPLPSAVLGFEVGEWHVRHDLLVAYMQALASHSDRVGLQIIGRTHEGRFLIQLMISSPENLARIDDITREHRRLTDASGDRPELSGMPVVVNLGYSVHGNEPSGANASLVVAYHLAAAQGPEIESLLQQTVIVLDPSLNPDGLSRFAQWANTHRGQVLVGDPQHREHREEWPSGRTNHYWFDLNRDWLLAQHPETRARLASFHRLRPNLLTDFHEMDTNSTYFFQPGVPSRQNPLTPAKNLELTRAIARFHARALEAIGSLFYTEERFDDFYYGKGSTYPDIQGSVGILFEQASSRGHLQETPSGPMSFPFTIRNQVRTSLSTLEAARQLRPELLEYQADFTDRALAEGARDDIAAWVVSDDGDAPRAHHFLEILRRHDIEVYALSRSIEDGDLRFEPGRAWIVPSRQPQYRLARALFETRLDFQDSTFYDVSTWTLPMAFDLPFRPVARKGFSTDLLGERLETAERPRGHLATLAPDRSPYAYYLRWDSYYAPRALYRLQQADVRTLVTTRPMVVDGAEGRETLDRGTILIPTGIQGVPAEQILDLLTAIAEEDGVSIGSTDQGLTPSGPDLGSPSIEPLTPPRPALFVGQPADTYEAGEIWHLLDHRFSIPLSLLRLDELQELRLGRYTHLILVDGEYENLPEPGRAKIRDWVEAGGVLITIRRATLWARDQILSTPDPVGAGAPAAAGATSQESQTGRRPYGEFENDRSARLISGAIFEMDIDRTHPLSFGLPRDRMPVFRNHRIFLEAEPNLYNTVGVYSQHPLLSGYISTENLARLSGSPALLADRLGRGAVVRLLDPPNFRSYWYGTNRLLLNALFFGRILQDTARQ